MTDLRTQLQGLWLPLVTPFRCGELDEPSLLKRGNRDAALASWETIHELTHLLFAEPSPAPAKYWLARTGLIDSAEVRLPMVAVSIELAARLDREIARRSRDQIAIGHLSPAER